MLIERFVLYGNKGILEVFRHLVYWYYCSVLGIVQGIDLVAVDVIKYR